MSIFITYLAANRGVFPEYGCPDFRMFEGMAVPAATEGGQWNTASAEFSIADEQGRALVRGSYFGPENWRDFAIRHAKLFANDGIRFRYLRFDDGSVHVLDNESVLILSLKKDEIDRLSAGGDGAATGFNLSARAGG